MAEVPYTGVPTVSPETRAPDDYQREQATPAEAGALKAQGLEKAGQGVSEASQNLFQIGQFVGKINVDDQVNSWITQHNNILYGDPSKTTIGPDGQPTPDTGYYGLQGRAASDARDATLKQLEDLRLEGRKNLKSPQEQLEYDAQTRRMYADSEQRTALHADQQWKSWAGNVNVTGGDLALSAIARYPDDLEQFKHNTTDLINFRVKEAQLKFGNDQTIISQAVDQAKAEATAARLQAIAVKDPQKALDLADGYQKTLSVVDKKTGQTFYDQITSQFRARADQQTGTAAGTMAVAKATLNHPYANPTLPIYRQAADQYPRGYSAQGLARTIYVESGGDPTAPNGEHLGLGQFSPATWKEYGEGDRTNPEASIVATQKYAAANQPILSLALHRAPTDAELYLAHQQGPFGAVKLLQNPNVRAGALVGDDKITQNGGDPNAPAAAFTAMWTKRFNNPSGEPASMPMASGASPRSIKGDAYAAVMNDPNLSVGARDHALHYVNTTLAAQQIADASDEKANKALVESAADEYTKLIHTGQAGPEVVGKIVTDPRLNSDWKTRDALINIARSQGGNDVAGASMQYGPGFWSAYKAVTAPLGDPNRITDPTALLPRAGPNGDLTLAGVQKLQAVMKDGQKSVNDASVNQTKVGLLSYAKQKLSFEEDTGPIKIRDPKGEALFNGTFIPKFEAAYDNWVKDGKNPWEFLTRENVDKLMTGLRPKAEMATDRLSALGEASPPQAGAENQPIPPPPEGVDPVGWTTVLAKPPLMATGMQATRQQYAQAVDLLRGNPTPENKKRFDKWFGAEGLKADDVLGKIGAVSAEEKKAQAERQVQQQAEADMQPLPQPTPAATEATPISSREGAGPAGYLGDLIRSVTPDRVKEYLQSTGR